MCRLRPVVAIWVGCRVANVELLGENNFPKPRYTRPFLYTRGRSHHSKLL